jgi:hypothetical protein
MRRNHKPSQASRRNAVNLSTQSFHPTIRKTISRRFVIENLGDEVMRIVYKAEDAKLHYFVASEVLS